MVEFIVSGGVGVTGLRARGILNTLIGAYVPRMIHIWNCLPSAISRYN